MLSRKILGLATAMFAFTACDGDTSGPQRGDDRITFALNGDVRTLSGEPGTSAAAILAGTFVAARADSVGGIVAVGFEKSGSATGNLFVLQTPRATGTFSCGDGSGATPCHGRYITGITGTSTTQFQRFFNVVSGSVTWTQIGPDRLRGTFSLSLQAADNQPNGVMQITNGVLDVPYVADPNANGALECLLEVAGIAGMSC